MRSLCSVFIVGWLLIVPFSTFAQTADEVFERHLEAIGGREAIESLRESTLFMSVDGNVQLGRHGGRDHFKKRFATSAEKERTLLTFSEGEHRPSLLLPMSQRDFFYLALDHGGEASLEASDEALIEEPHGFGTGRPALGLFFWLIYDRHFSVKTDLEMALVAAQLFDPTFGLYPIAVYFEEQGRDSDALADLDVSSQHTGRVEFGDVFAHRVVTTIGELRFIEYFDVESGVRLALTGSVPVPQYFRDYQAYHKLKIPKTRSNNSRFSSLSRVNNSLLMTTDIVSFGTPPDWALSKGPTTLDGQETWPEQSRRAYSDLASWPGGLPDGFSLAESVIADEFDRHVLRCDSALFVLAEREMYVFREPSHAIDGLDLDDLWPMVERFRSATVSLRFRELQRRDAPVPGRNDLRTGEVPWRLFWLHDAAPFSEVDQLNGHQLAFSSSFENGLTMQWPVHSDQGRWQSQGPSVTINGEKTNDRISTRIRVANSRDALPFDDWSQSRWNQTLSVLPDDFSDWGRGSQCSLLAHLPGMN